MDTTTKTCYSCGETSLSEFSKGASRCRSCNKTYMREYYKQNKERLLEKQKVYWVENKEEKNLKKKEYYRKNKDVIAEKAKVYQRENATDISLKKKKRYLENKSKLREQGKIHYLKNKDGYLLRSAMRRADINNATPSWLTEEHLSYIKDLYNFRYSVSGVLGRKYHVDHIVPLKGENVCGLHVPWNLRVIPAEQNLSKSNSFDGWS